MVTTKISSAMTQQTFADSDSTNKDILFRQYISDPIAAQTLTAQAVKLQIRGSETSTNNNLFLSWVLRVLSNDGTVVRGTMVAINRGATELATSLTNRADSATSTQVVAESGDRLVLEVGTGGDPTAGSDHSGSISIGDDSGTDLPEDETTTAANNPWMEYAGTIVFDGLAFPPLLPRREHIAVQLPSY